MSSEHCIVGRRTWSASVGTPGRDRTGHFVIVARDIAPSVTKDAHMDVFHLELAQLWRCPVEWCAVWKGSVCECLEHLAEKHGGSTFVAMENVGKFFLPWTVTRSVWLHALRPDVSGIAVDTLLCHEAGQHLVHRYRIYRTRFLTRLSRTALFPACCPAWTGPWPSPG